MIKLLKKYKVIISIIISIFLLILIIIFLVYFWRKLVLSKNNSIFTKISPGEYVILEYDSTITDFIAPFMESCNKFKNKNPNYIITDQPIITKARDWQNVCNLLKDKSFNNKDIYNFIKNNFDIYLIKGKNEAHITGYYRISLNGSLTKNDEYKYPIYKVPKDLISVNLGNFSENFKGITIFGRIHNNNLIPYYTREEINNGILENRNLEIVWLNNKYSAFLLHVQGSGLVKVDNKKVYLSYAAKNGHDFKGIYSYLKQKGYLKYSKLKGMDAIYEFFSNNSDKIDEVLNKNPSYIFFKEVDKNSWHAAFGTNPYAERTVAVDPKYIALGVPLLVNFKRKDNIVRLVVANDVGSAIKGPARIDFYWGLGIESGKKAEATNHKGDLYILIPKV